MAEPRRHWSTLVRFLAVVFHAVMGWGWVATTPLQDIDLPDNVPVSAAFSTVRVGLGPDEKEHYIYARSLAEGQGVPAPDPERRRRPEQWVSYQAQHPPLFYGVAAVLMKATGGFARDIQWILLRLLCLGFGMLGVWFGAKAVEEGFPERPSWAWASAGMLAAWPMLGHMNGNFSNEPMSTALAAMAWWWTLRFVRKGATGSACWAVAGLCCGAAALCRLTALIWIPGILFLALRRAPSRSKAIVWLLGGCLLPLIPWFVANLAEYGRPVLRTFHRPLFESVADIPRFLGGGIAPPNAGILLVPATVLLWFAGCVWLPIWLAQFHAPGGVLPISVLSLLAGIGISVRLAWMASKARRAGSGSGDAIGRDILLAAGIVVVACFAGQVWQMGWSDWDVVFSTGRYTVAAAGAVVLVVLAGATAGIRHEVVRRGIATSMVAALVALDLAAMGWVGAFYREHPTQDAEQRVERPN